MSELLPLRIGLVQLAVEDGAPAANLAHALEVLESAPAADLYLLPELCTTGYAHASWEAAADHHTEASLEAFGALAARRGAHVGAGMVSRREDGALVNRLWVLAPAGNRTWYDKAHLFPPFREAEFLAPGEAVGRAEVRGWPAGLALCFDLRFPGQFLAQARGGVSLFLVASAWPAARALAQETLARARATEHQVWLALVNRTGRGAEGTVFGGGSMLVAPDGTVATAASAGECVVVGVADPAALGAARTAFDARALDRPGVDGK